MKNTAVTRYPGTSLLMGKISNQLLDRGFKHSLITPTVVKYSLHAYPNKPGPFSIFFSSQVFPRIKHLNFQLT